MSVPQATLVKDAVVADLVPDSEKMKYLSTHHSFPAGIREHFRLSCQQFAIRYWVIDNSGSMMTVDGSRIVSSPNGPVLVGASRWAELADSLLFHAELAANLGAPTEFQLLNDPMGSPRVLSVGYGYKDQEMAGARAMAQSAPTGGTPLCARIREVVEAIRYQEASLRAAGKRALVVIASDGEPSDGIVEHALWPLKTLPACVVVRLCTETEVVVNFWNKVDADVEVEMDVLDDLVSEAAEIRAVNPYVTYGLALHRLREFGCVHKLFDLLDERSLAPSELLDLVRLFYGDCDLPHPEVDLKQFMTALAAVQSNDPNANVWDPIKRSKTTWINMRLLEAIHAKPKCCLLM